MTACGMCGDTGLQNGFPCPQPGCNGRREHVDVDPGDCDDSKSSSNYALVICGAWRPELAALPYPGGIREEHCFICGAAVATSNVNYARAQLESGELPVRIACVSCGVQVSDHPDSEWRGIIKAGRLPGDATGGNA